MSVSCTTVSVGYLNLDVKFNRLGRDGYLNLDMKFNRQGQRRQAHVFSFVYLSILFL